MQAQAVLSMPRSYIIHTEYDIDLLYDERGELPCINTDKWSCHLAET